MTAEREMTRVVRSWLKEDEHESAERIVDNVLARLDTTQQRRSRWPARRFAKVHTYVKLAVAAAALVAVFAVGSKVLLDRSSTGIPPSPSPLVTPTPGPTPRSLDAGDTGRVLPAGTYHIEAPFQQPVELTFADSWTLERYLSGETTFTKTGEGAPWLGFYLVTRLYVDPCHPEAGTRDIPVGGFQAFHQALGSWSEHGFSNGLHGSPTIAGHDGLSFTLRNEIDTATAGCTNGQLLPLFDPVLGEPAQTNGGSSELFWVVDLGAEKRPLVIVAETNEDIGRGILDDVISSLVVD
jgi:hypothetical protein